MIVLRQGASILKRPSRFFSATHRKQYIAENGMSFRRAGREADGNVCLFLRLIPLFLARKLLRMADVR